MVIGRPRLARDDVWPGLVARARGASWPEAVAACSVSENTLRRRWAEQGCGMFRDRIPRKNALTLEDRVEIEVGLAVGRRQVEIAGRIGKHPSTVSREIAANGGQAKYRALPAQHRADRAACRPKQGWVEQRPWVWEQVVEWLLGKKWSPEAIARRLRREHPDEQEWWVSHEAIYQAIYVQARPELRKELVAALQSRRPRRLPRNPARAGGGKIVDMVNIADRPPEADDRAVPGHWEGDLIIGKGGSSAAATLVERTSRFGLLIKLDSKNAEHVAERISAALGRVPSLLARSLTWDQGTEMAAHKAFSNSTGIDVYFCDPHSPWQRPSNEHWNGKVRWFIPKGVDLSDYTQDQLDEIAALINGRPREMFNWDTAAERFEQLVATTT